MRVTNGIPVGCPLFLPVHTVNCVQTLKAQAVVQIEDDAYVAETKRNSFSGGGGGDGGALEEEEYYEDGYAEVEEGVDLRAGEYDHPVHGILPTYLFENTRNSRLYFSEFTGQCMHIFADVSSYLG
jgi:hypothetical protein